jgi:hypothetical protein
MNSNIHINENQPFEENKNDTDIPISEQPISTNEETETNNDQHIPDEEFIQPEEIQNQIINTNPRAIFKIVLILLLYYIFDSFTHNLYGYSQCNTLLSSSKDFEVFLMECILLQSILLIIAFFINKGNVFWDRLYIIYQNTMKWYITISYLMNTYSLTIALIKGEDCGPLRIIVMALLAINYLLIGFVLSFAIFYSTFII